MFPGPRILAGRCSPASPVSRTPRNFVPRASNFRALLCGAGLHFALPVLALDDLPDLDRPLLALDDRGEPLGSVALPGDAVYAFGSERTGLAAELRARATRTVAIPMRSGVSSLNLATAAAVLLYALERGTGQARRAST